MTEHPSGYDIDGIDRRRIAAKEPSTRSIDLECLLVRYEDGPDRCTIAPRACPPPERLTTWLSADADAFVDLETAR